jgi:ATP-dependent Clp protease protease subunit
VHGSGSLGRRILLGAGAPGKRLALPNSRILIHQPYTEGTYGQASDIEDPGQRDPAHAIAARADDLRPHRQVDRDVGRDIERDKILTAEAAVEYGLVDQVLGSRKTSLMQSV